MPAPIGKAFHSVALSLALFMPLQFATAQEGALSQVTGTLVTERSRTLQDLATLPVKQISEMANASAPKLYAAGSLRTAFTALMEKFAVDTGIRFDPTYGPSGSLRELIEKGAVPAVFASANLEHPQALERQGILKDVAIFATNHLCLLAAPGVAINPRAMLDTLLNPALKLATSTPKIDPAGDYTWALFRKAEQLRIGSFDMLNRKAAKMLGLPSPNGKLMGVLDLLADKGRTDLVIAYCSYGVLASKTIPGVTWAAFPAELDVPSNYGSGISVKADDRAIQFQRFLLSQEGKQILDRYGFSR